MPFRETILAAVFLCLAAGTAAAAPLYATPADPFKRLSDKDAAGLVSKLKDGLATNDVSDHESFREMLVARDRTGGVEQHNHWNDYIVIQTGDGTLRYGGILTGAKETTPGEWRGGAIQGGQSIAIHAGDMITIPAGMPHQFTLEPGKQIRYITVKTRQ